MGCPSRELLNALLNDALNAKEREGLEAHVGECTACQEVLQRLPGESEDWQRWERLLQKTKTVAPEQTERRTPSPLPPTKIQTNFSDALSTFRPTIPGYEILAELGRGGMGVVFKARQISLQRIVALKVIIAQELATPEQRVRFQSEAEAVAHLQHPNIVQIFETGEFRGVPFFSLEFVEGCTLDESIKQVPRTSVEAAVLVETLARAIHCAHQQGIVHRDLKPANILLGADGTPKITDFGLVKRLDEDTSTTKTGVVMGTPRYMAPEQASGDQTQISTLVDVYAVGAILYELLTGRPPFDGNSAVDTLHKVRNTEPISPTKIKAKIPRDLETICLKCLQKNPAKRYPTALNLAEDLQRFLNHQPIQARPVSTGERIVKWARRRPGLAVSVAIGMVALIVLVGMGFWTYFQVRDARDRTEARFLEAQGVLDNIYVKVVEEWLADEPLQDSVRREILEETRDYYLKFVKEKSDDPVIRRKTALSYFRLGQIYRIFGEYAHAEDAYNHGIARQQRLRSEFPDDARLLRDLANSFNWRGELYRESGQPIKKAETDYRRATNIQKQLVKDYPKETQYQQELARSYYNLGLAKMRQDDKQLAENYFDQAIDRIKPIHEAFPENPTYTHELAKSLINRGVLHKQQNHFSQADTDFRQAIDLLQMEANNRPKVVRKRDLAVAHQDLGNLLLQQKNYAKALKELNKALVLLEKLVADFPTRPKYQEKLAKTLNSLGSVFLSLAEPEKAKAHLRRAEHRLQSLLESQATNAGYQRQLAITKGNLALVAYIQNDLPGARGFLEDSVALLKKSLQPNPKNPESRGVLRNQYQTLAEVLVQLKNHKEAVKTARHLADVFSDRPLDSYYAACFVSRCVPLVDADDTIVEAMQRDQLKQTYRTQAVQLLEETLKRLPAPMTRLSKKEEADIFSALNSHPDFAAILAKLNQSVPHAK